MLENETPSVTPNKPFESAAAERVTAEEFIAAIDRIEHRKAEESKRLAGTVAIGETIKELGIDASPDEVMAEVIAQRKSKLKPPPLSIPVAPQVQTPLITPERIEKGKALLAKTGKYLQEMNAKSAAEQKKPFNMAINTIFAMGLIWWVISMVGLHPHHFNISIDDSAPRLMIELPKVVDGQSVFVNQAQLKQLITHTYDPAQFLVDSNKEPNSWKITKHGTQYYLTGYILPTGDKELTSKPVKIYNNNNAGDLEGEQDEEITIPIHGANLDDSLEMDGWSEVTVSKVHPDSHLTDDQSGE